MVLHILDNDVQVSAILKSKSDPGSHGCVKSSPNLISYKTDQVIQVKSIRVEKAQLKSSLSLDLDLHTFNHIQLICPPHNLIAAF